MKNIRKVGINKIAAVILAGGKGTRMNAHSVNKVTLPFLGKPIIRYAVELVEDIAYPVVLVVGAFKESVIDSLSRHDVLYAYQQKRLGTGHAVKTGMELLALHKPAIVLVGYGDHMMFYKKQTIKSLISDHEKNKAAISLVTTFHKKPDDLVWGHIVRDPEGTITDIVEHKDASEEVRKIEELNPGFYCFDYNFLEKGIKKIKKSPVTGEYYLTDIIQIAFKEHRKVVGTVVPFEEVGIGVNKAEELHMSQKLYEVITSAE